MLNQSAEHRLDKPEGLEVKIPAWLLSGFEMQSETDKNITRLCHYPQDVQKQPSITLFG